MKKLLIEQGDKTPKIKDFQDWMDSTYPNWVGCTDSKCTNGKNLNKGKGYGTFGPSTTKAWSIWGDDFNVQYNKQSNGGNIQQPETVGKEKQIFDIYSKKIWFYNKNNVIFNLQEFNPQIGKEIDTFISDGFNQPSAFLGAILMNYGTQIIKYKTRKNVQDEIDKFLTDLQNTLKERLNLSEGFKLKKLLGLSQILEQISEFITVNVVNGVPKKPTEDDNYIDTNSKTIESVIEGGDEIRPGERNSTVKIVKPRVGYTVSTDAGNNFTENFKNHLLKYKSEKLLDYNNPNITQQLLCSFDDLQQMYPDWCKKFKKLTPTPSQTTQTNQTPEDIADINSPIPNK